MDRSQFFKQKNTLYLWVIYIVIILAEIAIIWANYSLYKEQHVWLILWSAVFFVMVFIPRYPIISLVSFVLLAYGTPRYGIQNNVLYNLNLVNIACCISLIGFILWRQKLPKKEIIFNKISMVMSFFFLWFCISYMANYNSYVGVRDYVSVNHSPIQYVQAFVLFFIASQILDNKASVLSFSISLCIVALGRASFLLINNQIHLTSDIGVFAAIVFPFCFLILSSIENVILRILWGGIMCCFPIIVLLTQNRNAGVAFGVVAFSLFVIGKYRVKLLALIPVSCLMIWKYATFIDYWNRFSVIWDRNAQHTTAQFDISTMLERLRLWRIGWAMFKENIYFGIGPGNYQYYVKEFSVQNLSNSHLVSHNGLVNIAAEMGIAGVVLYLCLPVFSIFYLFQLIKQSDTSFKSTSAKLLTASIFACISAGLFSSRQDYVLYYILLGWAASLTGKRSSFFGAKVNGLAFNASYLKASKKTVPQ